MSNNKIRKLEEDREKLQRELERTSSEIADNPTVNYLRNLVDKLKQEKASADQNCARLEYDLTLLGMEKEKFVTMLGVRDREIKEIQAEMTRIQEQVSKELKRLNGEVLSRVSSMKCLSGELCSRTANYRWKWRLFHFVSVALSSTMTNHRFSSIFCCTSVRK